MACNSCSKPFTLFRKEKGCPACGFSYCSKCLDYKLFVQKLNSEAKVCSKCKQSSGSDVKKIVDPPDALFKQFGIMSNNESNSQSITKENKNVDEEIKKRLQYLKEDKQEVGKRITDEELLKRLQGIKGPQPTTSDAELHQRLANLKGVPATSLQSKPLAPDTRTEQEQADDLMQQYLEKVNIDNQYEDGFNKQIDDMEARLQKLKGIPAPEDSKSFPCHEDDDAASDDEDTMVKKIIEKAKAESLLQYDDSPPISNDELPFCEICNEDATMRCLGCRYLFCKQCFTEHKDEDDGCDRYEPYQPPKKN